MKVMVTIYEDGNNVLYSKRPFPISDEADLEQKSEDIKSYILDKMYELEEVA